MFVGNATDDFIELANPYILIADKVLSGSEDVNAILEALRGMSRPPLLVIAQDVDDEALIYLVGLRMRGLPICTVKAPGYGDRRSEMIIDIATVTGGSVLGQKKGIELGRATTGMLGRAELVRVTKDSTSIYGGAGSEAAIAQRMAIIRDMIKETCSDYDREKLTERLHKIMGQDA